MRHDFLPFGKPQILKEDIERAVSTLETGWIGTGPQVKKFEELFALYKGVEPECVVALNSCTSALILALVAAKIVPGDEIITTAMTFCATINSIIHVGATPILVDIDISSRNIDVTKIEEKITNKTKAIMPVHFSGNLCEMNKIMELAKKYNLRVIEDCAHAIETEQDGKKAGTFGEYGCFSFYATKNLTTGGEGGAVICKNKNDAAFIRRISLHGMSKDAWKRFSHKGFSHYDVVDLGYKCNLTDYAASIGIGGLQRIEENNKIRQNICNTYNEAFYNMPFVKPNFKCTKQGHRHAYHLYNILINPVECGMDRNEFATKMNERNIGIGIHYGSITDFTYYRNTFGWNSSNAPNAKEVGDTNVSLPLSASMGSYDVQTVVEAVTNVFK